MNKDKGNVLLFLLMVISIVTGLSYVAFNLRTNSTIRALLKQRLRIEESVLLEYLSAHLSCSKTQGQACTQPIALRKSDNSVFLSAAKHTLGPLEVQAECVSGDSSIRVSYAKVGNWADVKRATICVAP